jgi:hypothetical protein
MRRIYFWIAIITLFGGVFWTEKMLMKAEENLPANTLIDFARKAVGGKAKLSALESLSASGTMRRIMGEMDQSGELQFEVLLPDKYRCEETMTMPMGPEMTLITALDGDQAWHDMRGPMGGPPMPPGFRTGDEKFKSRELREAKAEFARQILLLFLASPESLALEFQSAGKAEAEDGRADILDVTGPDNFTARLFLDEKTHLPLMLSYQGRAPQPMGIRPPPSAGGKNMPPPVGGKNSTPPRPPDFSPGQLPEPATVEIQLTLDDYRNVNGLRLPHHFSKNAEGKVFEEWDISRYKVNPQINPDRFKKK